MMKSTKKTPYDVITERILEIMDRGVIPWERPWNLNQEPPQNFISGKHYRGINAFLLSCLGGSPYWMTFNQAKAKGGTIRKGEKGAPVVFWKWFLNEEINEETGERSYKKAPMLRYYTVFNLDQIDGIEAQEKEENNRNSFDPIEEAKNIIENMPHCPEINHGHDRACYIPSQDKVNLPDPEQFSKSENYYGVAFHELAHSTGHESRLNRKEISASNYFGSHDYSKEELVAEMTASFLCGQAGIEKETIENSAAYLKSWARKFKDDAKMIVCAAAQAQKAADFILNNKHEEKED